MTTLQHKYVVTTDFTGKNFCGLNIEWDYVNGWVDILMTNYVKNVSKNYNIKHRKVYNMLLMNGQHQHTDKQDNMQPHQI